MGAIKRTPADAAFSSCIRERANWTCQRCGTHYADGEATGKCQALDTAHIFGRGNWSVRFDINNAICACRGCHGVLDGDLEEKLNLYRKYFGDGLYDMIKERRHDTGLGRYMRKNKRDVAAHYREQYRLMREAKSNGHSHQLLGYV